MAWSSFEKDKLLAEGWRKFLQEEEQIVFGINSDKKVNPESLLSFLEKNQAAIGLSDEDVKKLLDLMLAQTKEDDVVLEAIGGPQRDARTFSSDTTTKLNAMIKTFGLDSANEKKLEKVLNRWAKLNTVTFEPGEAATPAMVTYEPDEDEGVPTPAAEPEPATDEEEAETVRIQPVSSTEPAEQPAEKTPAQTAVDLLNGIDSKGQEEITVELFNDFVRDLKSFIGEINKQKSVSEITRKQVAPRLNIDIKQLNKFISKNNEYKVIFNRLRFASKDEKVLNSFVNAFERVAKSLSADTPAKPEPKPASPEPKASREPAAAAPAPENNLLNQLKNAVDNLETDRDKPEPEPEPAGQEEEPRGKSPDLTFTRITTKRIKDYYNKLEIIQKLSSKFDDWKQPIENNSEIQSIEKFEFDKTGERSGTSVKSFDPEKNGLYLITLKNGEQFGLPKHTRDVSTLGFGFEWDGQIGNNTPFNEVTKLAKIKDGKIIEKGEITWGERGSTIPENILNESLMLRWKTIAGIK